MGKFDNIAILTDLDGTFFDNKTRVVKRNIEAIEYFKSEGGLFSLCTGRVHCNLERAIPDVDKLVNAPALLCNGAYFYDFGSREIMHETYLDREAAYKAAEYIHTNYSDSVTRVSCRDGYIINESDERAEKDLLRYKITAYKKLPFSEWRSVKWYKIVIKNTPEVIAAIRRELSEKFLDTFEYNNSGDNALEIQAKGINKSSLYQPFKEYYAKKGKKLKVYVCGDNENDLEVLKVADVAVCPSNAIDSVKAISDLCLCSNNDGLIADLIYSI